MDKLPYELVDEIMGYMKCHRGSLIACSQLCKAWRQMLLPYLFETVVFRYKALEKPAKPEPLIAVKQLEPSWVRTLLSKMFGAPSWVAPARRIGDAEHEIWNETMRALVSSEEKRLLIKYLYWWSTINFISGEHLETLGDVLALLPNVQELELSDWVWKSSGFGRKPLTFRAEGITTISFRAMNYSLLSQFEQHLALFPCCISMDLSAVRWSMYDVDRRVQPFPRTLKRLSVEWMNIAVFLQRFFEVKPPIKLTSVALNPLMGENMAISHRLFTQVGPTLTDLSIGFQNVGDAHLLDVSPCVNLVSLNIVSVPTSQWGYRDKTWVTTLLEKFAIARRLQTITITSSPESNSVTLSMNSLDVDSLIVRLFPRLRLFSLRKATEVDADADADYSIEPLRLHFPKMFAKGMLTGELLR